MKYFLLLAFCFCITMSASAQTTPISVKGAVIDSASKKPLGFVTVSLTDAATKQPVKSTLTKDDGTFEMKNLAAKPYQLTLVYIGYGSKTVDAKGDGPVVNLGNIVLSATSSQLKEVAVTGVKPLMKQEVDRIAYDVQADPESKALTALDMMRKVPLLAVDASDNIKLKGSGNYKILINGKESALMAKSPSDVLKAMPATNIEKIEVITTPPAKYDAEGLSGIINIITKKNADQGYNIGINGRYNTVWGPGLNLNGNVKQGKFGMSGYVGFGRQNRNQTSGSSIQNIFGPGGSIASTIQQSNQNEFTGHYRYANTELSYEIDTLNLLTGSIELFDGKFNSTNSQLFNSNATTPISYNVFNATGNNWMGMDAALNYQLGFKRNKEQLLTLSYKYSHSPNKTDNTNNFLTRQNYPDTRFPDYQQYNNSGNREHTVQLDYAHPLKKITIEAGAKGIFRNNFSDFFRNELNAATGIYVPNPAQTNNFNYRQNVSSLYNSYQLKLEKWTAKAGMRLEHTTVNADFTSVGQSANQDYNNFIPSISVQRKFKNNSVNLGYTERIQRPGIYQLNPFVDRTDPKFVNTGNPNLRPELSRTFELTWSNFAKNSFTAGFSYAFSNNAIQTISYRQIEIVRGVTDTVTYTSYQNLGTNKNLGFNVNTSLNLTKDFSLSLNGQISKVWLAGTFNGQLYKNSGFVGNGFMNTAYKFKKGYRLGIDAGYFSGSVNLQGSSNRFIYSSLVATKELLDKKMTISLVANNPWSKYQTWRSTTITNDFAQYSTGQNIYRSIALRFNYKFGRLNSEIKRNQRGINNDDTKSGGGSKGGNG